MPDGTEMPAPVSATTEPAPRTNSASLWTSALGAGGGGGGGGGGEAVSHRADCV
jgi:hypothetical protein